jgi:hypothetical protein
MSPASGVSRQSFLGWACTLVLGLFGARAAKAAPPSIDELVHDGFDSGHNGTLAQKVQMLMDREEIRELVNRYSQCASRRISMAPLFTDDGAYIIRAPNEAPIEAHGRAQIEKFFSVVETGPSQLMPSVHNQLIGVDGDSASALSWVEGAVKGENEMTFTGAGYYEDRLRRENGRWKFVERATVSAARPKKRPAIIPEQK